MKKLCMEGLPCRELLLDWDTAPELGAHQGEQCCRPLMSLSGGPLAAAQWRLLKLRGSCDDTARQRCSLKLNLTNSS